MRKRVQIALAVLLVAVAGVIGWQVLPRREREPVYQGKGLGAWLEAYPPNQRSFWPFTQPSHFQKTDEAVRAIGTNAIPILLQMLRARDTPWKLKLVELASKQQLFRINYTSATVLNDRATTAFRSLKENASNAVPLLVQIYKENRSEASQNAVVLALGSIGPAAVQAVPCLLGATASSNLAVRQNAIVALGEVMAPPELAVPVLMEALHDPDAMVRGAAASWLSFFAPRAKSAVPALLKLLEDKSSYVSSLTAEALKQIDPEAATRAGVK